MLLNLLLWPIYTSGKKKKKSKIPLGKYFQTYSNHALLSCVYL